MGDESPQDVPISGLDAGQRDRVAVALGPGFRVIDAAALTNTSPILDSLDDGVCLVRADGTPEWSNAPFKRLDQAVRERILAASAETARVLADGEGVQRARRLDVPSVEDDTVIEAVISPLNSPNSEGRVVAMTRDVTVARLTMRKMEAIDSAGSALVRLDADTVRNLNASVRLGVMEEKIVAFSRDVLNFDNFAIRLIDRNTNRLDMVMSSGFPQSAIDMELYPALDGNGVCGYVAKTGRSYIVYDVNSDERFLPGASGAMSSLTIPLRLQDQIIGVMDIESTEVGAFSEDDKRFAVMFGRYVALALHMLDLLVVERSTTNADVSGRFEGELSAPLEDILREAACLGDESTPDVETKRHIERIKDDVEAIRKRMKLVASGRGTLLGADKVKIDHSDPLLDGKRVLVADDDEQNRGIIADVLGRRGCRVQIAENGEVAIKKLEAGGPFDLVISDINMPDRNGYEVFASAKKLNDETAVILMTGFGYDPHHSIVRASQEGLQTVLFKPFQASRLVEEVRSAMAQSGSAAKG